MKKHDTAWNTVLRKLRCFPRKMVCLGNDSRTDGKANVGCTPWALPNVACWARLSMRGELQKISSIAGKLSHPFDGLRSCATPAILNWERRDAIKVWTSLGPWAQRLCHESPPIGWAESMGERRKKVGHGKSSIKLDLGKVGWKVGLGKAGVKEIS